MTIDELKELLDSFLNRWTNADVKKITLNEYVGIGNKDTFCQWVETKTRMLGSIKGMTSIKFGIYERNDPKKKPKNYHNDSKYSWLHGYGQNRQIAFENTKKDILKIIEYSEKGQFDLIDDIILPDLFKWKVAFLYSNERLIPIYKREVLLKIAEHFGLSTTKHTKISEIQNRMIANKPANKNVYEFMRMLYDRFGRGYEKEIITGKGIRKPNQIRKRQGTNNRNIQSHIRTIARSYVVEQKHNKIQESLKNILVNEYGKDKVILEENYVDIKLIQSDYLGFYEVKSSSYACECIKEALGQILLYSFVDTDKRKKKIYIVGQYPANIFDIGYIEYIKNNLKLEFDYISVEI